MNFPRGKVFSASADSRSSRTDRSRKFESAVATLIGSHNAEALLYKDAVVTGVIGVIFAGIRVATVIAVGVATIAAAIGAGGLGMFIFRGTSMLDYRLILAGAIPAAAIALAADFGLSKMERYFMPVRKS